MTILSDIVAKLEEIKKYALEPSYSKLSSSERITKPTDGPVIKRLKKTLDLEDKIKDEEYYTETRSYSDEDKIVKSTDSLVVKKIKDGFEYGAKYPYYPR